MPSDSQIPGPLRHPLQRGPHPLSLFLALALQKHGADQAQLAAILLGLRRYQGAPQSPPQAAAPALARRGDVVLRSHGGPETGPLILVVPSLINAPAVLDLAPDRSLVAFLVAEGFRVRMVDWGPMQRGERRLGLAGLVSARLLPLIASLDEPVSLVGYCLGGTLALAAAARFPASVERLALIAAPWHFDGFDAPARASAVSVWQATTLLGRQLGALPISLLNPLFWSLDEDAVLAKFAALASRDPDDPAIAWFARVEDWANSGAPLGLPAARDLFERGFQRDHIGRGRWKVAGVPVSPEKLICPVFDIGATRDRIVPKTARIRLQCAGIVRADVDSGHVGMVVGGGARKALWEPLSNWLRTS